VMRTVPVATSLASRAAAAALQHSLSVTVYQDHCKLSARLPQRAPAVPSSADRTRQAVDPTSAHTAMRIGPLARWLRVSHLCCDLWLGREGKRQKMIPQLLRKA